MKSLMMCYVKNSADALAFYQTAFTCTLVENHKNADGSCAWCELNLGGCHLVISEHVDGEKISGNQQMFILDFGKGNEGLVEKTYNVLKDGASIIRDLGEGQFSSFHFKLVDKFGIFWCVYV